ncbi:MAG: hypothetical protein PGN11_20715 [Quadrisphaera sp.]
MLGLAVGWVAEGEGAEEDDDGEGALELAVGLAPTPLSATKATRPSMGWPSLDVTRQSTV